MAEKLKSRFPTAKQIVEGIEFASPLKSMPGWTIFVRYDLTTNPKNDDEWIDDFQWKVKKPANNGTRRRFIVLGTNQLGLDKLDRVPEDAQAELLRYTQACWDKKIDAAIKEVERRWDAEEREAQEFEECGS